MQRRLLARFLILFLLAVLASTLTVSAWPQDRDAAPVWEGVPGGDVANYLAVWPAGPENVRWSDYGRVLHVDGRQALVRTTPERAEQMAADGAEIKLITLAPKPLRRTRPAGLIPTHITYDPLIHAMMEQVHADDARQYLGGLSGEWPVTIGGATDTIVSRHTANPTELAKAVQYVGEHLEGLNLDVSYQPWTRGDYASQNVIGEITGRSRPDDIFILSAHLDDMPRGDTAPGADDNGSGSTAVLIAADILSQYDWDCTLRFALWTGEEQGLLGSADYARQADAAGENILGVINLDMIAWNTPESDPVVEAHYNTELPASQTLANLFADVITTYHLGLTPVVLGSDIPYSDHASFWDYGYPAILGIEDTWYGATTDFNPDYHTTDDLLGQLDQAYFTDMIKAAVGTYAHAAHCLIPPEIPTTTYRVIDTFPHDPDAFTQGLVYEAPGYFYEGTGMYQASVLRKVKLESGSVVQERILNDQPGENYFGEGVTIWEDEIMQLTWKARTGFVYDKASFAELGQFTYPTEGWGLTHDGQHLIMSDGTATIHFLDPDTFAEVSSITVTDNDGPVVRLNELEYIQGEIYANVWQTDRIARIDPVTGRVVGWIDLAGLKPEGARNVLNGIAYDAAGDRLFVTGKYWPKLFEIELIPQGEDNAIHLPLIGSDF
jgi:glutamine cyclotransferase